MFKNILLSVLLAGFSITAQAQISDTYKGFVRTLNQALSFNEVVDHQLLDINEVIKKREASNKPFQCIGLNGDQVLEALEKEVLYVETDWLTDAERKTIQTYFVAEQEFIICKDEKMVPKSDDFYQASLVLIINKTTNEGLAFRVDWIDGDVIDEP